MPPLQSMGKILLIFGSLFIFTGLILLLAGRLGAGKLPGDLVIQKDNITIYIPLATMIIVSIIMSILFSFSRRFLP